MYINYVNNIPEYTVTQLNRSIKELLEEKFDYIKLIGESGPITIANSGHVYFSINSFKNYGKLSKKNPEEKS